MRKVSRGGDRAGGGVASLRRRASAAVVAWVAAVALLSGCDGDGGGGAVILPDATPDAMPDAMADAMSDAMPDAMPDAMADDATVDAGPGACPHPPGPAAGRSLGLDLLDVPQGGDFGTNLTHAATLGARFLALHLTWDALDVDGQPSDRDGILAAFAGVLDATDLSLSLTIRPIDIVGKTVPADLEGLRFSDPRMADRFNALIDYVVTIVPAARLISIQVGNEIDGYDASGEDPAFWQDYGVFLAAVTEHARARHPGLPIGFTVTLHGALDSELARQGVFDAYARAVDVIGVTYYPIDGGFGVRAPSVVFDDLDRLVAAFPERPIRLQEVGYPASAVIGSDEALQARFFCDFFAAWDAHAARIPSANIVRLFDYSAEGARQAAGPYGLDTPAFVEYLRTLGLRTADGAARPAFEAVRAARAARGL